MAIYRFRVTFEDYDEVIREIDMLSKHTFLDFHQTIHQATGYDPSMPSSFYVSNDQWKKGQEIAFLPDERKIERGIALMEVSKLNKFIDDPHQKFYYTYNFGYPFDFHIQLIKITKEEADKTYPLISKSIGQPPKPLGVKPVPTEEADESADKKEQDDDYDFLNETEYGIDESEDLDQLTEDNGDNAGDKGANEDFGEEF